MPERVGFCLYVDELHHFSWLQGPGLHVKSHEAQRSGTQVRESSARIHDVLCNQTKATCPLFPPVINLDGKVEVWRPLHVFFPGQKETAGHLCSVTEALLTLYHRKKFVITGKHHVIKEVTPALRYQKINYKLTL